MTRIQYYNNYLITIIVIIIKRATIYQSLNLGLALYSSFTYIFSTMQSGK